MEFSDLKLNNRTPLAPETIKAYVGTDCILRKPTWDGYKQYVIVAAAPTDDPCVAAIEVERKRLWRF